MRIVRTEDLLRSTTKPLARSSGAMRSMRSLRACAVSGQERALRVLSAVRWLISTSNWVGVPFQPSEYFATRFMLSEAAAPSNFIGAAYATADDWTRYQRRRGRAIAGNCRSLEEGDNLTLNR
jgi:hypothetical protein